MARSRSGLVFYPGKSCSDGIVSTLFLAAPEFICGIIADYCVIETPLKKIYVYDSVLQLSGPHEKATKTGGGDHRQHQMSPNDSTTTPR